MGLYFDYPEDFEDVWSVHPHGVKKLAYDQWVKLKPTTAEKDRIVAYLKKRQKEDKRWVFEGKIHHLRTILSQRHFEAENYEKIKTRPFAPSHRDFEPTQAHTPSDPEKARMALAEAKRAIGVLH